MDTQDIVWIVVAALVVLALLALVAFLLRRRSAAKKRERLAHAEDLRGEAAGHAPRVQSAAERARTADVEAEAARARATQAEREAADAHQVLAHEQAAQEDVVRRADELDPRVDTRADDYRPVTGPDMKARTVDDSVLDREPAADEGRHRGHEV